MDARDYPSADEYAGKRSEFRLLMDECRSQSRPLLNHQDMDFSQSFAPSLGLPAVGEGKSKSKLDSRQIHLSLPLASICRISLVVHLATAGQATKGRAVVDANRRALDVPGNVRVDL